ncbi:MAG TPA: hypothetical protein VM051_06790 [Usitatibacter sp.]|nr:hypothetical protein [Usitatibacter sp.]
MRILIAILFAALALPANATFHLWYVNEIYSNADGSVQFIEMKAASSGQQFIKNHTIRSTSGSQTHTYTFPNDLPGDSAEGSESGGYGYGYGGEMIYKTFLIATQGFTSASSVTPDFVVPNGFLFPAGGTIVFAEGADTLSHGPLPSDGRALTRDRAPVVPSPVNFAGVSGTVALETAAPSYQGLWLKTPFASESGWGINFTHQGTVLFATWFTYDTDGGGMWLVMSSGNQTGPGRYEGDILRTTGPGFNAAPFTPLADSNYTRVGTLTVTFSDVNTGSMTYTVNGVTQTKPIARYVYAAAPTCTVGGTAGPTPNYGDLWWRSEAESGWGVNIVHQGDILFATWFTYAAGGTASSPAKGMWLVMSNGNKTANGVYTGGLQRTTGPNPFSNTTAFDPNLVQRNTVGDATFTFTDANTGTFRYTVDGITQTKPIQRLRYSSPATVCR